jgi:hypothetical protein
MRFSVGLLIPLAICAIVAFAAIGSKNITGDVALEIKKQSTTSTKFTQHEERIKAPGFGPYKPAPAEAFVVSHTKDLKLDVPLPD